MKIRGLFISVVCLFVFFASGAQGITENQYANEALSSMFDFMELQRVPTGYLLDRAVESIDIRQFDGSLSTKNYGDLSSFRECLMTLNSSIVNNIATNYDGDAITNNLANSAAVNLGIALINYNYISANALTDNLITYQNGKVHDVYVSGIWQNPYSNSYVCMLTPGVPGVNGLSVHYVLNSGCLFSNTTFQTIEFDAGDGVGYRTISSSYDGYVLYSEAGDKELRMRITLGNNTVLESHARISVFSNIQNYLPGTYHPDYVHSFVRCLHGRYITATVTGVSSHSGLVVKPFIYVEGFDEAIMGVLEDLAILCDSTYWKKDIIQRIQDGFFSTLYGKFITRSCGAFDFNWFYGSALQGVDIIKDNYDVFYIDFSCPEADISDNAQLLCDALSWINSLKADNSGRNIVMGHSMGGLIARYALRTMEIANSPHETDYFVSYDSPQMGVNLPLGLQYAFRDLCFALYGDSQTDGLLSIDIFNPMLSLLLSIYNSTSARQMMYYYVEDDGTLITDYHSSWQSSLATIGFPQGDSGYPIENLSIVNGGPFSVNYSNLLDLDVSIGNGPFSLTSWMRLILPMVTRASNLELSIQAFPNYGNGCAVASSSAVYYKHFAWLTGGLPIYLFGMNGRNHIAPIGSEGYDAVNGSYLSCNVADTLNSGSDYIRMLLDQSFLFIPSSSALAMEDYHTTFFDNPPIPNTDTPFDAYYLNDTSFTHTHYSSSYFSWIHSQATTQLIGPEQLVLTGDAYSLVNLPTYYSSPDWSLSSNTVTITNGVVNVSSPGQMTTILCKSQKGGAFIYKRRRVLAGFPSMTLSTSNVSGDQFMVTAECVSNDSELRAKVAELLGTGDIKYIWGIKNSNNSYSWTDTTSVNYHYVTAQNDALTSVCFKMYNGPGRESAVQVRDIDRRTARRYMFDPQEIVVDGNGYNMNYMYISGLSSYNYLAVWCNPSYQGTAVAPDTVQIGVNSYSVETSFTQVVDGNQVTVYCFDILDDPWAQQSISDAMNGTPYCYVPLIIRGNGVLMPSILPIVSVSNP